MKSGSKLFIRLLLLIFIFEVGYIVAANIFLRSKFLLEIVNKPNKTFIGYEDAWTVLPGLVHVHGFSLSDQDKNVQWSVEVKEATGSINLLVLPFKRLNITKVSADGVAFKLRRRKSIDENTPGIPDIPGFSGVPEPSSGNPEDKFRFLINNVRIENLNEIWIDDHRFEGFARAKGSFYVWPRKEFDVRDAELEIQSGEVNILKQAVAENLKGTVFTTIRPFPTQEKSGSEVFDHLSGLVALNGKIGRADFLNVYLQKLDWIRFDRVEGEFSTHLRVFDGVVGASSDLSISVDNVEADVAKTKVKGSGKLKWIREEADRPAVLNLQLGKYQISEPEKRLLIMTGGELALRIHTREPRIRNMWSQVNVHLELPPTEVHQLKYFNRFIPKYSGVEIKEGKANLKGVFNLDTQGTAEPSYLQLLAQGVNVASGTSGLRGDLRLEIRLKDIEEGDEVFDISGTSLSLENVFSKEDRPNWVSAQAPWQGEIKIEEGRIEPGASEVSGKVSMKLVDLRPLLEIYSVRNRLAPWVKSVLRIKNIDAKGELKIGPKETFFRDIDMESQGLGVQGWYKTGVGDKEGALLVDLGIMDVGVDVTREGTKVILTKVADWYKTRLTPGD